MVPADEVHVPVTSTIARQSSATALAAAKERRRARAHVRDYGYVKTEVRSILLLVAVMVAGITAVSFLFR